VAAKFSLLELKPCGLRCAHLELTVPFQAILFGYIAGHWLSYPKDKGSSNTLYNHLANPGEILKSPQNSYTNSLPFGRRVRIPHA
jgi:hypothetical protein